MYVPQCTVLTLPVSTKCSPCNATLRDLRWVAPFRGSRSSRNFSAEPQVEVFQEQSKVSGEKIKAGMGVQLKK